MSAFVLIGGLRVAPANDLQRFGVIDISSTGSSVGSQNAHEDVWMSVNLTDYEAVGSLHKQSFTQESESEWDFAIKLGKDVDPVFRDEGDFFIELTATEESYNINSTSRLGFVQTELYRD